MKTEALESLRRDQPVDPRRSRLDTDEGEAPSRVDVESSPPESPSNQRSAPALTHYVSARDVQDVLGCSRSAAYDHLRCASGQRSRPRGLLRVALHVWEAYAERKFGGWNGSSSAVESGGAGSTMRMASGSSARRSVATARQPRKSREDSSEPQ